MMRLAALIKAALITALLCSPCYAESLNVPFSGDKAPNHSVSQRTLDAYSDEIKQFYSGTSELRHNIWEKIHHFAEMAADPGTIKEDLMALQAEIQELNNELQRQELSFRWDLDQHFPEMATDRYRGCIGAATGTRGPGR